MTMSIECALANAHCAVCPFAYSEASQEASISYYESGAYLECDVDLAEYETETTEAFFARELLSVQRVGEYYPNWRDVHVSSCPAVLRMDRLANPVEVDEIPF